MRAWWTPPCICFGDNLPYLQALPDACVDLAYFDPPFNTRRPRKLTRLRVRHDPTATRVGFQGRTYRTEILGEMAYPDVYDRYLHFLAPRLQETLRVLRPHGNLILHLDPREVHYVKALMDVLWGEARFMGQIIWAYDYGGRPRKGWPAKHDVLLWYAKTPGAHRFDPEEAANPFPARGKAPYPPEYTGDVWWHTIVPTTSRERTGYPTQKPLALVMRLIRVYTRPGDLVLDAFAGSGTTGEAAARLGRTFLLMDVHEQALRVMMRRLAPYRPRLITPWAAWFRMGPFVFRPSQTLGSTEALP